MQGTYTHIPETNYVPREHGLAAILLFLFMVLISLLAVLNPLYFYISTFRSIIIIIIIVIITIRCYNYLLCRKSPHREIKWNIFLLV